MKKLFLLILGILLFSSGNFYGQEKRGTIVGKVVDKSSQEPIPGVNIIVVELGTGDASGIDGEFTIKNVDIGNYRVKASAIGFDTIIKTDVVVNTARPTYLLFEMSETVIELEGVTVSAGYFDMDPTEANSIASFNYEEIRRVPGGFEDVIRALSVLPGVAQASPGRNDLVVRGGAPSENLYIVDGFVFPNINHFGSQGVTGGALSFVNLDYVSETSFSSGGFSAMYGDKLSSVLDINLREGRNDRIGGKATISASQFGLNLEGPINSKGNFIFSLRRSYLDFIFNAAGFNFVPEYYDLLSKATFNFDSKNKLSFLFIGAYDHVRFNNETSEDIYDNSRILGSNQIQYVTGLSYRHLFDKGFYSINLSRNFVDYDTFQRDTLFQPVFLNKSREGENELKTELVYKTSSSGELNIGASIKLIKFSADLKLPSFFTTFGDTLTVNSLQTSERYTKYGLYSQYSDVLIHRLSYSVGARLDYYNFIDTKFYLSPRLALTYMLTENTNLNFSTGVYYQSPSYIWLAAVESNRGLKALRTDQFIVGLEQKLREDIRFKVEGFYKSYSNYPTSLLRPYLVLANTGAGYGGVEDNFSSFGLEPLVSKGKGNVGGIEFSLQKKSSDIPLYAILSVTYSKANFTALDGIERLSAYDQTWIVNLSAGYNFNEKWQASFKFRYATGNPYTPFENDGTQLIADINSVRVAPLHSLDVRVDRKWNFDGWSLITYLDVQNVYNRKNTNAVRWNYREGRLDDQSSIGILPSIGISVEF